MRRTFFFDHAGNFVERVQEDAAPRVSVIGDIQPYRSMVDGSMVTGRRQHRDHLRDHGVVEVGNETMETKIAAPSREARRQRLREQLWNMSDKDANRILARLRENPHRER